MQMKLMILVGTKPFSGYVLHSLVTLAVGALTGCKELPTGEMQVFAKPTDGWIPVNQDDLSQN